MSAADSYPQSDVTNRGIAKKKVGPYINKEENGVFLLLSAIFILPLINILGTSVRKYTKIFGILLTYSYLCSHFMV